MALALLGHGLGITHHHHHHKHVPKHNLGSTELVPQGMERAPCPIGSVYDRTTEGNVFYSLENKLLGAGDLGAAWDCFKTFAYAFVGCFNYEVVFLEQEAMYRHAAVDSKGSKDKAEKIHQDYCDPDTSGIEQLNIGGTVHENRPACLGASEEAWKADEIASPKTLPDCSPDLFEATIDYIMGGDFLVNCGRNKFENVFMKTPAHLDAQPELDNGPPTQGRLQWGSTHKRKVAEYNARVEPRLDFLQYLIRTLGAGKERRCDAFLGKCG